MKTLLISYFAPQSRAIGARRPASLAKHLLAKGIDVDFLTSTATNAALLAPFQAIDARLSPGDITTPRFGAPEPDFGEAWRHSAIWETLGAWKNAMLSWPEPPHLVEWYGDAKVRLRDEWTPDHCELVVSSGPPWVCHKLGWAIARAHEIPWIPDYRDLWTPGTYYPYPLIRRRLDRATEMRWLRSASAVTSVTPGLCAQLERLAPNIKCSTIWNGFDQQELEAIPRIDLGPGRHVVYAGSWYPGRRDPRPLLAALASTPGLSDVAFHVVGERSPDLEREIAVRELSDRVMVHGPLGRLEALSIVKAANVALVLGWNDPRDRDVLGGKVFELIGMGKAILALGYPRGILARVIHDYGFGELANEPDDIAQRLSDLLKRVERGEYPDTGFVREFERTAQLEVWEALLREHVQ